MSLVLRQSYQGDPGLFSFLGKAVKGIAGVVGGIAKKVIGASPLGRAVGVLTGGIAGGKVPGTAMALPGGVPVLRQGGGFQVGGGLSLGGGRGLQIGGGLSAGGSPGAPAMMQNSDGSCTRGHLNKSRYYSAGRGGVVEPGTVCVTNRRLNPLNPRALSKSMRRLTGFVKATRSAEKMIQRMARPVMRYRSSGGCATKKCKR